MLTAENWTASNRLLLLELAPDKDRNAIRVRFVIGQGNPAVRQKLYGVLDSAGLKSKRTKITDTWTRLATETLVSKLDQSDEDPDTVYQQVVEKLASYSARMVPKADAALRAFAP